MTKSAFASGEFCIAITGLPGSGKSTIGKQAASLLGVPLLDKDDYLEALFEERGSGDSQLRSQLYDAISRVPDNTGSVT